MDGLLFDLKWKYVERKVELEPPARKAVSFASIAH